MNIQILKYLDGTGTDDKGRTLDETLQWNDIQLERTHDFIQWWFPTYDKSAYNLNAPRLDHETERAVATNQKIQQNILRCFERFKKFLLDNRALTLNAYLEEDDGRSGDHYVPNHNHLRISRLLSCMCAVGLNKQAKDFFHQLHALSKVKEIIVTNNTLLFWADAVSESI